MSTLKPDGLYCAYLRKSRRDEELEALGHGETLQRHERQLRELAERLGIRVAQWYREIVSGDTLAARPQAQKLLEDVNGGLWDGVLAMDVDRFGRGDSIDQGLIMQSMSYAGALVITPEKIYDPADEADAEFFEIKLFFARREYNAIKKRMQRGRIASVMEGSYLGGPIPYGYDRHRIPGRRGGWTLKPNPAKAEIVRAMYTWYAYGMDGKSVGTLAIAQRLYELGVKTDRGLCFTPSSVSTVLHNITYTGKVQWNRRTTVTKIIDGQRVKKRPLCDKPIIVDGLHEAIITPDLFEQVQSKFQRRLNHPINTDTEIHNPLAGLVICDQCHHHMQRKLNYGYGRTASIYCPTQRCPTFAAYLFAVEDAILDALRGWVRDYEGDDLAAEPPAVNAAEAARAQLNAQRDVLRAQLARQYDAMEQGIYSMEEFRRRRAEVLAKIDGIDQTLGAIQDDLAPDPRRALIPQVKAVLASYQSAATPADKNALLRTVVDHVEYHKDRRCYRNNAPGDYLILNVYPVVPQKTD